MGFLSFPQFSQVESAATSVGCCGFAASRYHLGWVGSGFGSLSLFWKRSSRFRCVFLFVRGGVYLQFLGIWVLLHFTCATMGLVSLMGLLGCEVVQGGLQQVQVSVVAIGQSSVPPHLSVWKLLYIQDCPNME